MKLLHALKRGAEGAVKEMPALRAAARGALYVKNRLRYLTRGLFVRTNPHTVVFESYGGRGYACSPKAIYEYMLAAPAYKNFEFVWLFSKPEDYAFLRKNGRTAVLRHGTGAGERALCRAKYWVMNFRAADHLVPRRGQVYVQCWHGTPLKKLGYDLSHSENSMSSLHEIHHRYRTDAARFRFLLSPSPFATAAFQSAWRLQEAGRADAVLELGYPRNDFLFTYTAADVQRIKERLGLSGCAKKIVLYAPTWRDNEHTAGVGYTYACPVDFEKLRAALGETHILLFRAHYLVANAFDFSAYGGFVRDVSGVDDINELYVISDMLITDYSSVFFDYANLKRPMLFFMYDLDFYRSALHDFYLEPSALPGEIVQNEAALIEAVRRADSGAVCLEAFNRRFNPHEDGHSAKRVTEAMIG